MKIGKKGTIISLVGALAVCSCLVLAVGSCDDDGGGGSGQQDVTVEVTVETLCSEVAEVMCHNMFLCCTGLEIEMALGIEISTEEDECRRDMELECLDRSAQVMYALEEETATLDEAAATDCLEFILAPEGVCFDIAVVEDWFADCEVPWITGAQAAGAQCYWDFECSDDAYCAANQTCRNLPAKGEECDFVAPTPCASGLYCGGLGTCELYGGLNDNCTDMILCGEDFYCDLDPILFTGTCLAKNSVGGDCRGSEQCTSAQCSEGACADGTICWSDLGCAMFCDGTTDICWGSDLDCAGLCDISGAVCTGDFDCIDIGDFCVHDSCLPPVCGGRVCVDDPDEINYCVLGLTAFNLINN